eukprot:TRINITY_DN4409_c0_g1_i2.p1 TRINITY_DN4409_c0_g1~~TRINITY_DN4409_c0_g1_i2.p1  ORF type:complete len:389 (-),score=78.09 TRINITY_DN4409_c0_g1_i2:31-1197(-)
MAIKTIDLSAEDDITGIKKEIEILKTCRCPNIVCFFGCFVSSNRFWILMDYCALGSLRDIMNMDNTPLKEKQVAACCQGALKGLVYLHKQGIIHRDIKCGNILLDERGEVKLADFGVSAQMYCTWVANTGLVGSVLWMAPEIIRQKPYNQAADIWSLGVTAVEMADGEPPHADTSPARAMMLISRGNQPTVRNPKGFSKEFLSFLEFCLNKQPEKRPAAADLLQTPFIQGSKGAEALKDLVAAALKKKKKQQQKTGSQPNLNDLLSTSGGSTCGSTAQGTPQDSFLAQLQASNRSQNDGTVLYSSQESPTSSTASPSTTSGSVVYRSASSPSAMRNTTTPSTPLSSVKKPTLAVQEGQLFALTPQSVMYMLCGALIAYISLKIWNFLF